MKDIIDIAGMAPDITHVFDGMQWYEVIDGSLGVSLAEGTVTFDADAYDAGYEVTLEVEAVKGYRALHL